MSHFFAALPTHPPVYFLKLVFGLIFVLLILAGLQAAPRHSRKQIVAFFTFVAGLYFVLEFFLPTTNLKRTGNFLTPYLPIVANISTVIQSFAIGLGVLSLVQLHTRNIVRRRSGWGNSAALLISFVAMTVFGILNEYYPRHLVAHIGHSDIRNSDVYNFLFAGGLNNFGSAMFALIAFFIASASYRAFRIRSIESSFLMIAGLIVMLGSVSFGTALTSHIPTRIATGENPWANLRIENIAQWLMLQVNAPAQRGILFGLAVGELAVALRLWLSLERSAYFDKEI